MFPFTVLQMKLGYRDLIIHTVYQTRRLPRREDTEFYVNHLEEFVLEFQANRYGELFNSTTFVSVFGSGGAIYLDKGILVVQRSLFINNTANQYGGSITSGLYTNNRNWLASQCQQGNAILNMI